MESVRSRCRRLTGGFPAGKPDALPEVVHRDIHPYIAVEVDHDGVDAAHGVEQGGQIVVV